MAYGLGFMAQGLGFRAWHLGLGLRTGAGVSVGDEAGLDASGWACRRSGARV